MPDHRTGGRRRPLSVVRDDPLPDVRIDSVGTVLMSDEQYAAATQALAALIGTWRAAHAYPPTADQTDDAERPRAA